MEEILGCAKSPYSQSKDFFHESSSPNFWAVVDLDLGGCCSTWPRFSEFFRAVDVYRLCTQFFDDQGFGFELVPDHGRAEL